MLKLQTLPTRALAIPRANLVARWLARPVAVLLPLIVLSSFVRSAIAWKHETPRYFPDEYIYAALGRSLAHGHYEIRGHLAHFPALLEPLLAAPLWRFFSTETAYHLVQAENAVAASLVAVPIYLLARWLGLGRGYSYLCAIYGLLIPAVSLAAENLADLVAYPLVLTAIAVGVRALDKPSPKRQLAFLAFATLATLARTQYFVLVPAYIVAALLLERRRMFRAHKVAVLALIPVAAAITVAMLGFYSRVRSTTHLNGEFFKWFVLQSFLLALAAGVAIVPGALIALLRPTHRREIVFSLLAGVFMVLLFCESAVYAANSGDFKERYLFSAMPLFALAYGVYLKRGRPHPYAVVGLVAVIVVAASRLPISVYAISTLRTDSQFLYGVSWLELRTTYGSTALAIALIATAAGAFAVWTAFKGDRLGIALVAAIVVGVAATVGAVKVDLSSTRATRALMPQHLTWVDAAAHGPVTAIETPYSSRVFLLLSLYWNRSIKREVILDDAVPTDSLAVENLQIDRRGRMLNTTGDLLLDRMVTSASFWNASVVAHQTSLTLWHAHGVPRLRTLIVGRYADDWLNESVRIRAWPQRPRPGHRGTALAFTLSLPHDWSQTAHMRFGRSATFTIAPGSRHRIVCWNATGPVDVVSTTRDALLDEANRPLAVQLSKTAGAPVPPGRTGAGCAPAGL
jgi:Dolichyl-phosphate-mannose-protein mannosyltransferase